MRNRCPNQIKQILKFFKFNLFYYYIRANFYINKIAITVERDLSSLVPIQDSLNKSGLKLVEITSESLSQNEISRLSLVYPDEERKKTAIAYLKKGYRGVALVNEKEVSGDIWYTSYSNHLNRIIHPDLKWLRMKCGANDVYAFDMYLYPGKRGKNLAILLQNGALHEIKRNGYSKALGYYWADNIPALWVHRTLKWKELKKIKVTRFLGLHHSFED